MSGFLTNLLRRGAGLPPLVAPRRMDLPADLPVPEGEEEWAAPDVLSPADPAMPEPERRRSPEAADSPAPAPQAPVKAAEAAAEAMRTAPVPSVPPPVLAQAAQTAPREQAARAPVLPKPAPEQPPEPAVPPPLRQDQLREAQETIRVLASPRVNPPLLPVPIETRIERIAAPPEEQPLSLPAPAPPAATPKAAPPAAAEPPLPLAPIAPPPETPAALHALDEAQPPEEPRIEVRIGRIEIRQAPPPPPPAPAPRREPRGFPEHSLARRYLDRRWY